VLDDSQRAGSVHLSFTPILKPALETTDILEEDH